MKSRLYKGWWLIRLCWRLIRRHSLKHRVVANSRKLSCKLLVYCVKLGKGLLKLWRELTLRKSTVSMAMAISRRMYLIVWYWRSWNITLSKLSLGCMYGLINLLWVVWSSVDIRATMCMLRRGSLLTLAWVCGGR